MSENFRHITNGINLVPNSTTEVAVAGDLDFSTDSNKANLYNGTSASPVVTEAHTATLTNKTLSGNTASNLINGSGTININSSGTITIPNATDTLVGKATTDVLTNKTLSGNTSSGFINGSGTLSTNSTGTITIPNATDTLVGKATTDVLTNKTIDTGSNTITNLTNTNLSGSAAITNANLAQMSATTIKGNSTGGSATPSDLSATTVTSMLNNVVGDSGSGGTKGLVPAPASGDAAANKFLKANGSWANVTGAGVLAIGTIDSQTASANGAVISGTDLVMQSASATRPGLVNNTTQTMNGAKTFSTSVATPFIGDNTAGLTIQTSSNQNLTIETLNAGRLLIVSNEGMNFSQSSTPSNPSSGFDALYFKNDDLPYFKTSAGTEVSIIPATPTVSASCGSFSRTNSTPTDVTNLSVTVTNSNTNAVWNLSLNSDGSGNASEITASISGASVSVSATVLLLRNNNGGSFTELGRWRTAGTANSIAVGAPTGSINFKDINPPVGTNIYKIQLFESDNGGGGTAALNYAKLVAFKERF